MQAIYFRPKVESPFSTVKRMKSTLDVLSLTKKKKFKSSVKKYLLAIIRQKQGHIVQTKNSKVFV